jgi:vacuolar-type H+-ATPase subunit I/STV1
MFKFFDDDYDYFPFTNNNENYKLRYVEEEIKKSENQIQQHKKAISDLEDRLLELRKQKTKLENEKITGLKCLEDFKNYILKKYENIDSINHLLTEFEETFKELQDKVNIEFEKINNQYKLRIQMKKDNSETLRKKCDKLYKIFNLFINM